MSHMQTTFSQIGVIGAGAMGSGIAQIAAQAGCEVQIFDVRSESAEKARDVVFLQWDKLLAKGRLDGSTVEALKSRLHIASATEQLSTCDLVIEAIVERLDAKKIFVFSA